MNTTHFIAVILSIFLLFSCGDRNGDYSATGSFEANEVIVSAEANGRILSLNEEGEQINEGKIVGAIDSTQLYLQK